MNKKKEMISSLQLTRQMFSEMSWTKSAGADSRTLKRLKMWPKNTEVATFSTSGSLCHHKRESFCVGSVASCVRVCVPVLR